MKEKNKNIPTLRFKEFSGEWEGKKLENIAKYYDGTHQTPRYVEKGIPFYSVEHLTANQFEKTKFISKDVFEKENKRVKLEKGDILMTRIGSIGVSRYIDWDVNASFYVSLALIKKSDSFNSSFLDQVIKSSLFQRELWKRTIHVAFPQKINLGEIGKCKVFLPSKNEQEKISSFLFSIDKAIEQFSREKSLLEEYKKGMTQKLFNKDLRFKDDGGSYYPDWKIKKMDEILTINTGNKDTQNKNNNGKYPFFVRSNTVEKIDSYSYDGVAILTSGDGVGVGKNFHYIEGKFDYHQRVYCMSNFNKKVVPKYVFLYFSNFFYKRVKRLSAKNSVDSVRMDMIAKMTIPLPSINEQQKIASFLSSIDEQINYISKELQKADLFKKGLLQKMFV